MIYGIGIDLVEVERIKNVISRFGDGFLRRVFTEEEIVYCNGKVNKYHSLAARFCAKEAVIKALGSSGLSLSEIEVVSENGSAPKIRLKGRARERLCLDNIHLSLSHTRDYALAQVIIEGERIG